MGTSKEVEHAYVSKGWGQVMNDQQGSGSMIHLLTSGAKVSAPFLCGIREFCLLIKSSFIKYNKLTITSTIRY